MGPNFPANRPGFIAQGAAPPGRSPFLATGVNVRASVSRGPFGGWVGRFRERLSGSPRAAASTSGAVHPQGTAPSRVSLIPHKVSLYARCAFWSPTYHYKRSEYLVSPPSLPGTAIPYTLFHPVYIPGLQGWMGTLPWNYAWIQGRNQNFERWNMLGRLVSTPVTGRGTRQNVWKPAMKIPQGVGQGRVWQPPYPYYVPPIINPGGGGTRNGG